MKTYSKSATVNELGFAWNMVQYLPKLSKVIPLMFLLVPCSVLEYNWTHLPVLWSVTCPCTNMAADVKPSCTFHKETFHSLACLVM